MTFDLGRWLVGDLDDAVGRLQGQVLGCVPVDRRKVRADGGGSSIDWAIFHVARHAGLALAVLGALPLPDDIGDFGVGAGLDESEAPWAHELDGAAIEADATATVVRVRAYLEGFDPGRLNEVPDSDRILSEAGVPREQYGWLYAMWAEKPVEWFVRWPLLGHLTNHVGEMIADRATG